MSQLFVSEYWNVELRRIRLTYSMRSLFCRSIVRTCLLNAIATNLDILDMPFNKRKTIFL